MIESLSWSKIVFLAFTISAFAACSADNASGPDASSSCGGTACAPAGFGGGAGSVGAGGAGQGGVPTSGSGGTHSPEAGGTNAGGTVPSGGAPGSSGTAGVAGASGAGDSGAGGSSDAGRPLPAYTLVVDAPANGATVNGVVVVRGRAPGFVNVEVWDAAHRNPPLARTAPAANGAFQTTVDTAALGSGTTTWTVYAWDSAPGQSFTHTANVPLSLTIGVRSNPDAGATGPETVGVGDISSPAVGPPPSDAAKVGGRAFTLVKNWDFGTNGTVKDTATLISEFVFHDQFNTIANGTNYGAVIVAPTAGTAITNQPVEDPAHPNREWTADSMLAHVRPLSPSQTTVTVSAHDAGNGSVVAKWKLPSGGAILGKDLLWETRARMPAPLAAYWFAIWTSGNQWNKGAEMDVLESFGTPNIYPPPAAFHVNSVGGSDTIDYSSWPNGLTSAGVPTSDRDLRSFHTWTWVYKTDDTYVVYFDGYVVQTGTLHWTLGGGQSGQSIDMDFLFDFGWGHTQISDVNISLPASSFPLTYEIDYSRVYLR